MINVYPTTRLWRMMGAVLLLLAGGQATAQVSGTVFRDLNAGGTQTSSNPEEPGASGVTVRAYVNFSTTPVSTTNTDGNYVFTAAHIPTGARVRIESADFYRGDFVGPANVHPTHVANAGQVGAIWGTTALRSEKNVLLAASINRHTGLGTFGKSSGLGDSIQTGYEPGADGISLKLFDMDTSPTDGMPLGTLVASTTTANGGLLNNRAYQVRMPMSQLPILDLSATRPTGGPQHARKAANGTSLELTHNATSATRQYFLSPAFVDSGPDSQIRDNNAVQIGPHAVVSTTVGSFGQNEYNSDFAVYSCPVLDAIIPTVTVCAGASSIPDIPVAGQQLALVDSLRFVYFTSPQSGTAMYTGGMPLGTFAPSDPRSGTISLTNAGVTTANSTTAPITYYVYGIIHPTPIDPQCRVSMQTTVTILPPRLLRVAPSPATLTCIARSVTLVVSNARSEATYRWTAPNSTTSPGVSLSTSQPGVYTVVGTSSLDCGVASVTVLSDQTPGSVSVTSGALSCLTPTVTLTATVSGKPFTSILWTGPSGAAGNGPTLRVHAPGTYRAIVTFANGCVESSNAGVVTQGNTTIPPLEAYGGAKLCPTCSVTLLAVAEDADFLWTGPNNFTSRVAAPVVQDVGNYTVVVTDQNTGCKNLDIVVVEEPSNDCPGFQLETPETATICSGERLPIIRVQVSHYGEGQQISFVQFTSPQSATSVYTGGTTLATVTPNANLIATLDGGALPPVRNSNYLPQMLYIYEVVVPQQPGLTCEPTLTIITVNPGGCPPLRAVRVR